MAKHLYIIGNGFDLHHKINSSYKNFQQWMYENNPDIIEKLMKYMVFVMMNGGRILKINWLLWMPLDIVV